MTRLCSSCAKKLHGSNQIGVCLTCQNSRTCIDCSIPVSTKSSGRCRSCTNVHINSDPLLREKKSAAMKRHFADPAYRANHLQQAKASAAKLMQDPAHRQRLAELGRKVGARNIETTRGSESRQKAGRAISAQRLSHVPSEYRTLYVQLRDKNLPAAERLKMVLEQQAADRRNAGKVVAQHQAAMREKHRRQMAARY